MRCQLQKSWKKRPGSSDRLATFEFGLGALRLRSIPRSANAISSAENKPRMQTAPSRAKAARSSDPTSKCFISLLFRSVLLSR
jgi:hypothetical protein